MSITMIKHPTAFLSAVGGTGTGASGSGNQSFKVEFAMIGARMKRCLVEAMIEQKTSAAGIRCWRILEAKGKLDEKHVSVVLILIDRSAVTEELIRRLQLAKLAFLAVKEARETISLLGALSLIEPQEVPRSADRAPSRTFYLWFVDYEKVINSLLGHHYKALASLRAQRQHQLGLRKSLVERRNRKEVRDAKDAGLTTSDRYQLKELDKVLEALSVAEMRIDQDIFVLKEMDP